MMYEAMGKHGFVPKDIRIVKCRETGQSRGFGFVEFVDVNEAIRWMLYTQGRFQLDERSLVDMEYSFNKNAPGQTTSAAVINYYASAQRNGDWTCAKCNTNNFKKRDTCFKCNIRHDESDALNGDGFGEIGVMPCDTLLLRNLPPSADEQYIMVCVSKLTSLDLRRIVVARNPETKESRCFAYLEMNNLTEAAQLLTTLTAVTKLNIDGKEILVSYSKHTLGAVLSGASLLEDNHQTLPLSSSSRIASGSSSMPTDVTNAAAAVAQNAIKKAQVLRQVAASHIANTAGVTTAAAVIASPAAAVFGTQPILMVNPAAAAAAAMLLQQQRQQQNVLAAQAFHEMTTARLLQDAPSTVNLGTVMTPYGELPKYREFDKCSSQRCYFIIPILATPNVSLYQYESSSGFYYDPSTGLYYDGKSQYYFNSETQQYLYWDASYQTYLPAPSNSSSDAATSAVGACATNQTSAPATVQNEAANVKKAPKEKEDKVKTAKQIQKDMERWAKQNAKSSNKKGATSTAPTQQMTNAELTQAAEKPKGAADAAFSVLAKTSGLVSYDAPDSDDDSNDLATGALRGPTAPSSSATANTSSSSPDVDMDKLACLLCRRQFPSLEVMLKHQQFSDLHKQNLEAKNRSRVDQCNTEGQSSSSGFSMQYRDRAKERRQKFGDDDRPMTNKLKQRYLDSLGSGPPEQPTASGIGSENIGNKLLKTMGWQEGQGLGRKNQGITDPVKQQRRVQGAGLGAGGVLNENGYALSYKDQVLATMRQKYYETT
uniref:RNA-binding protein 5 n=1 Tax=Romanomermis culicivorax TaxID=13658 RepID=A0A915HU63_ROMCU